MRNHRAFLLAAVVGLLAAAPAAQASKPFLTFAEVHRAFAKYEPKLLRKGDSYRITDCRRFSPTAIVCREHEMFDVHSEVTVGGVHVRVAGVEYVGHRVVRMIRGKVVVASMFLNVKLPAKR